MHRLRKSRRAASRIASIFVFIFVLGATANAYTVIMRGGRRIEIPAHFVVTPATLTYEAGPGIQITLQVAAIDIPATEKANNETTGSFLRRAQSSLREAASQTLNPAKDRAAAQTSHPARTITNRDLEALMRRRRDSERAYENRRKELGLPSAEESRERAEAESDSMGVEFEQRRVAEKESETYWRGRAEALRTEMAALDAEIAFIRARLDEGPSVSWNNAWIGGWSGGFNTFNRGTPFGNFGRRPFGRPGGRSAFPQPRISGPNIFVAPTAGAQISGRIGFGGGATRGQLLVNPAPLRHPGSLGFDGGFPVFSNGIVFGSSIPGYDLSYERTVLITHFNELAAARAGLSARWRELEDEARRAGALPGWLRP
jgi:hypothetical protein